MASRTDTVFYLWAISLGVSSLAPASLPSLPFSFSFVEAAFYLRHSNQNILTVSISTNLPDQSFKNINQIISPCLKPSSGFPIHRMKVRLYASAYKGLLDLAQTCSRTSFPTVLSLCFSYTASLSRIWTYCVYSWFMAFEFVIVSLCLLTLSLNLCSHPPTCHPLNGIILFFIYFFIASLVLLEYKLHKGRDLFCHILHYLLKMC